MSNKKAVIGLGNTLRGDDGIGILVLESLLNNYRRTNIDYLDFGSASFDLINCLRNYEAVILIDGINAGLSAGELKIFSMDEVSFLADTQPISSHELNLKDIFRLTQELGIKTKIYIVGIQIKTVVLGFSLSEELKKKEEVYPLQVEKFIEERFL